MRLAAVVALLALATASLWYLVAPPRSADAYRERAAKTSETLGSQVQTARIFGRPAYLRRAMEAGAAGYLVKDAPAARLANAIRRAVTGERVVDPELAAAALADGESPLTPRERELLEASGDGSPIVELAARLHLSEGTVRNYLSAAIGKTGGRNRAEALRIARERGWL